MRLRVLAIFKVFLDWLVYRRFIEGFSNITKLLTELLEKDKKFKWTQASEANFQELKKRLMTALI
jgi:hypothetical protein